MNERMGEGKGREQKIDQKKRKEGDGRGGRWEGRGEDEERRVLRKIEGLRIGRWKMNI